MRKLLIAEHSDIFIESLKRAFCNGWRVHIETDGAAVCDRIRDIQPDAMILNLRLPGKDGLQILEEIFPEVPPVVLLLTDYTSEYILQSVTSLGVGCILQMPFRPDYVRDRIDDMHSAYITPPNRTGRHLNVLGVNTRLSGYRCLSASIANFSKDPSRLLKEIYPETAKECGLNDARCVEHTIRTAIRNAWQKRNVRVWSYYFPTNDNGDIDLPTNKEFISAIVKRI